MSTTKELSLCKGLPYQIRARANGKFDYVADNQTYSQDTSVSLSMTTYNGLSEDFIPSYQTADITDFGLTTLPWGYEYNQSLGTSRFCLMPIKHDYSNVTPKVATQDYSVSGSVTFDSTTGYVTITGDNYIYKKVTSPFTAPSTSVEVQLKLRTTQYDTNQPSSYAELQSNRTILPGPITFGCGYNQVPQRLLGTVSIPAHTVYDYDNGTWTESNNE